MVEPITAAAIATLLVTELAKSSAGEAGKKLVGDLWGAIARRFQGNPAATETLEIVKADPSAENARDLETFLRIEMRDAAFATALQQLAQQIQELQTTGAQRMVTDLEVEEVLEAGNLAQRSITGEAIEQTMVENIKAQSIKLGDLPQEQ